MFMGKIIKEVKAYTLKESAEELKQPEDDILAFLKLRNYIIKDGDRYYATILGLEVGCVVNVNPSDVIGITEEGLERMRKAFCCNYTEAERAKVLRIVDEYNSTLC